MESTDRRHRPRDTTLFTSNAHSDYSYLKSRELTKLGYFFLRVKQQSGEHEQSVFRVLFVGMTLTYLVFMQRMHGVTAIPDSAILVACVTFLFSILLVLRIIWTQSTSRTRQWFAMFVDLTANTYVMATTQEYGAMLFGGYLWVITGNSLRYGIPSLLGAYFTSIVGFSLVIWLNEFWQAHLHVSIGLMLMLILVPLYTLKLRNQLNQAIENAKEASKVKSQFLAHMSHEMRTPLNGLAGAGELLLGTSLNSEQLDLVKSLKRSSRVLRRMIDNVLDLSKIENGVMQSEKTDFDLHDLINNAAENFLPQATLKGLKLNVRFTPATPFALHGDAMHLLQVIINLVGNALKFTDRGTIDIYVSTTHQDRNSAIIRFEVIDTGIGIPFEAQNTVFDLFTQADISIARKYGGTGLGTTIARDLVKLMGGQIGLQSMPGTGSTFWFELPMHKQPDNTSLAPTSLNQLVVIGLALKSEEKATLSNYLKGWGVQFEQEDILSDFFLRLQRLRTHQNKGIVVICSPQTFNRDAKEFAHQVLTNSASKNISLILLDPQVQSYSLERYIAMGYTAALNIPLDKTLLFNSLHSVMTPSKESGVLSFTEHYSRNITKKKSSGVHILVAEDNATNRMIVSKMLEHGGHKVSLAVNGEQALDMLEHNSYDLLILDMNMPIMGGLDVVKIHRAISGKKIPIVILTANESSEAMRECEEVNVDAFLAKPVDTITLLDTVARLTTIDNELVESTENAEDPNNEYLALPPFINEITLYQLNILGGEQEEFLSTIINGFISETERLLISMQSALINEDYIAFREIGHVIKGSSGNVGADAMHMLFCSSITNSKSVINDKRSAESMLAQLQPCFIKTKNSFLQYLETKEPHLN